MSASVYIPPLVTVHELRAISRLSDEILALIHQTLVAQDAGLAAQVHDLASETRPKVQELLALTERLPHLLPKPIRPAFTFRLRRAA